LTELILFLYLTLNTTPNLQASSIRRLLKGKKTGVNTDSRIPR